MAHDDFFAGEVKRVTQRKKGYLLIALAAALYSTTEVALKGLSGYFAPLQLTSERVLIGSMVLLPFALREIKRRSLRLTASDWRYFTVLGFLTVTLHMSLLQMAVMHMDASAAAAIYSGNPVFTVFAAHLLLREPLKKNHLLALGLEVTGILFILNPGHLEISLRGFVEIISATMIFALYGTICKLRVEQLSSVVITCFALMIGSLCLLAVLLLGQLAPVAALYRSMGLELCAEVPLLSGFTLRSTLLMLYAGIFCAGIGMLLMAKIVECTSATEGSFVYLIKPILATLVAMAVFHEYISTNRAIGIGFFVLASMCVLLPALREMKTEQKKASA